MSAPVPKLGAAGRIAHELLKRIDQALYRSLIERGKTRPQARA